MKKALLCLAVTMLWALPALSAQRVMEDGVWYRLHFGGGIGAHRVSLDEMQKFIGKEVLGRFPDGFTITEAKGQWTSQEKGMISERTTVVDIQCPDTPENKAKIDAIAQAYVSIFKAAQASLFVKRISPISAELYY